MKRESVDALVEKARLTNDHSEAIKLLQRAFELDPSSASLCHEQACRMPFSHRKAELYLLATQLEPNNPIWLDQYAISLYEIGQYTAALEPARHCCKLHNKVYCRVTLGRILIALGRSKDALDELNIALNLRQSQNIGIPVVFRAETGKSEWEIAYLYSLLAMAKEQLNNKQGAIACLREAVRLNSEAPHYHKHLGDILKTIGLHDEAESEYNMAISLLSDFSEV